MRYLSKAILVSLLALLPQVARASATVPDSYGAPSDVHAFCSVVEASVASVGDGQPRSVKHVVVIDGYAVATVHIAFDSYNVMSRRSGATWSEPYSVGPLYPRIDALTERGIPRATAARAFRQLQSLDAIPLTSRKEACT